MTSYISTGLLFILIGYLGYIVGFRRGYDQGDHNGFTRGLWKGHKAEQRRKRRTEEKAKVKRPSTEEFAWLD